jgi:Ca-activated chloride channel family protein
MDSRAVSGPNDSAVIAMADAMQANGSTNLNAGLTRGYDLARRNFVPEYLNRVVLISDGQANTGVTDEDIIASGADLNDGDGIYLVGVGVGEGVNDTLMDTVTDKGRGAYIYLDDVSEADRMFVTRFDESMDVAARAVQVRLDLPWYLGVVQFSGEQMSTNAKAVEPQHLAPNDAMVFEQLLRPCSAEQFVADDPITLSANWLTPTTHESRSTTVSTTLGAMLASTANHLPKGKAVVAYAEALKAGATQPAIANAMAKVAAAQVIAPDAELQEIDLLLQQLLARTW